MNRVNLRGILCSPAKSISLQPSRSNLSKPSGRFIPSTGPQIVTRQRTQIEGTRSRQFTTTRPSDDTSSSNTQHQRKHVQVEGATEISHSQFISSAGPSSDFNPTQTPLAGTGTSQSPWEGHLSPTKSHLFKLVLPLPTSNTQTWSQLSINKSTKSSITPQPTAFLLHPSQPLSHLARLITGSLPSKLRDSEISFLALTGQEDDLDSHLRNAEEEEQEQERVKNDETDNAFEKAEEKARRQEGGPYLQEREKSKGRFQEVTWSQSTDLSDFIKQSCLNEKFKIVIAQREEENKQEDLSKIQSSRNDENADQKNKKDGLDVQESHEMTLEVIIPSFASRTTFLRKRLIALTKELDTMTKKKKSIDLEAHKSAQRLAIGALGVGVAYWVAVIRWTFFTDAGWDMMEPVTWATGFGALLCSCAFLVYHNREVSYSSLLDLSITARQRSLYDKHGLDIERWTEMVAEAKTLRREVARIAADYDIEWKGELENLAKHSGPLVGKENVKLSNSGHELRSTKHESKEGDGSRNHVNTDGKHHQIENNERKLKHNKDKDKEEAEEDDDDVDVDDKKLDIDKTIDEAAELAEQSEEKRAKEKAAQRKGEVITTDDNGNGNGSKSKEKGRGKEESERVGREKGKEMAD